MSKTEHEFCYIPIPFIFLNQTVMVSFGPNPLSTAPVQLFCFGPYFLTRPIIRMHSTQNYVLLDYHHYFPVGFLPYYIFIIFSQTNYCPSSMTQSVYDFFKEI